MRHEKPELSKKNPYYIPKHRYYELKHLCLQYKSWKRALAWLDGWHRQGEETGGIVKRNLTSDPTAREAILRAYYSQHIELIDNCIAKLEPSIQPYILEGVTRWTTRAGRARWWPRNDKISAVSVYHDGDGQWNVHRL